MHRPEPIEKEYELRDEDFIVSKTDQRGVITYVNRAFMDLAKYSESELIGKPHSLVRHPDMRKVAFKGLWDTVKLGEEWHGIVKNLAKDGAYYWVDATVTPSYHDGEIVGYMSVRRKPTRDQIDSASELYKQLISEEGK
jgi:aerotaxis receptor